MRVATFAELARLPAGTIFCFTVEGYADGLFRKGESADDGSPAFVAANLLPYRHSRRPGRKRTLGLWPDAYWLRLPDAQDGPFFVFDPADVAALVAALAPDQAGSNPSPPATQEAQSSG